MKKCKLLLVQKHQNLQKHPLTDQSFIQRKDAEWFLKLLVCSKKLNMITTSIHGKERAQLDTRLFKIAKHLKL